MSIDTTEVVGNQTDTVLAKNLEQIANSVADAFTGPWVIAALYQFKEVANPADIQSKLQTIAESSPLCGTLILANEGINGTIAGSRESLDAVNELLRSEGFVDLEYKESHSLEKPFQRTKFKLKREIVTLGVPVKPLDRVGHYLNPREWDDLLKREDVVIVDTRNDYEYKVGTFRNAMNPNTTSFAEFPEFVRTNEKMVEAKKEKKKVAMFCTGGIRCEKSTSFMLQEGYDDVYHLKGGILKYLEETEAEESLWDGECFVFDNRTCVTHKLQSGTSEVCDACGWPVTIEERETADYEFGVSCPNCVSKTTDKQKNSFRKRVEQKKHMEYLKKKEAEIAANPPKKQKLVTSTDKNEDTCVELQAEEEKVVEESN